jgi:hypothetical protein
MVSHPSEAMPAIREGHLAIIVKAKMRHVHGATRLSPLPTLSHLPPIAGCAVPPNPM